MTVAVSSFIASYGLLAVFVLMVVESCGIPFPSEVIMPTAGLLSATGHLPGGLVAAIFVMTNCADASCTGVGTTDGTPAGPDSTDVFTMLSD